MGDLYDVLAPFVDAAGETVAPGGAEVGPLQLAIVGRPNVGKSTMINYLLGEDRMLTGPEAGITRDSISVSWTWESGGEDYAIRLIDTAGLRRKARVSGKLETLFVGDTLRTIRFAEVVVLVVDAMMGLEKQDLSIARMVVEEGRVLILAINKWDAAKNRKKAMAQVQDRLQTSLPQVRGVPVITCSALTGK
uniref:GTP-binding protein n=1 Tax=uncultured Nocardioides sp. TaxID=198441 RepID=UPI002609D7CB